jgi:pimeloyl-ACP methyl ester carboxylesterase
VGFILKNFDNSDKGNKVAIGFARGFTGDVRGTRRLHGQQKLDGGSWPASKHRCALHLQSADTSLQEMSNRTECRSWFVALGRVALVAQSMGGLVAGRVLVKYPGFRPRVAQDIVFGTPSRGPVKATQVSG